MKSFFTANKLKMVDYAIQNSKIDSIKNKIRKVIETPCKNCNSLRHDEHEIEQKLFNLIMFDLEIRNLSIDSKISKLEDILKEEIRKPCNECGHTYKYIPSQYELKTKILQIKILYLDDFDIKSSETDLDEID